jgi:hypothetical protein
VSNRALNLYPIADVQVGALGVDEEGFRDYVTELIADPIGHAVGAGDYTDGISPSNRRLLAAAFVKGELYDTLERMIEESSRRQVQHYLGLVDGSQGKWDAVLSGHHFYNYRVREHIPASTFEEALNRVTIRPSDADIAQYLGAPYIEEETRCMINYVFPAKRGQPAPVLKVLVQHGQGSGATLAAPLMEAAKNQAAFEADLYIIGHHHKLVAARAVRLAEDLATPTQLLASDATLVACGSWMRGFLPNETTYAEAGGMQPLATGAPIVHVVVRDNGTFRIRTEI